MAASVTSNSQPPVPTARSFDDAGWNPAALLPAGVAPAPVARKTVAAWACVILSDAPSRLARFAETAARADWDPIVCRSVGEAIREVERWRTQLAIIDLGTMPSVQKASYLQFAERIACRDRLLLVCDEPTNGHESELQARQAGAWLYLPSPDLSLDGTDEFAGLLGEARGIASKLARV